MSIHSCTSLAHQTSAKAAATTQQRTTLVRSISFAPARLTHFVRAAAAAALLIGYVDLIRGGTVIAPVLLVAGYVALVPAVILTWR